MIRLLDHKDIPACLDIVCVNWGRDVAQYAQIEFGQAFGAAAWKPVFYVDVEDTMIVGLAGYASSWINYGIYDLTRVDVHPALQGKGIGHRLVDRCISDIMNIGSLVMLSTTKPAYYEKFWNFQRCFEWDGNTIMRLDLS
jgi:predicted N-acetyltransferase YhbS